jgi:hypothetical protein
MVTAVETSTADLASHLGHKRLESVLAILGYAAGGGAAAAAPKPGLEAPSQLVLTASDILMYTSIWRIYFHEALTQKALLDMLIEVGLVTVTAAGTAYLAARASTALLNELSNWAGPLGWGVSALLSGSLTGLSGAVWAVICDRIYCDTCLSTPPPAHSP